MSLDFHRSAGACPPRALACTDDGEGQALALREGEAFFYRSAGALGCHTRIRAGFPRDVERVMKHPHKGEGQALALREGDRLSI